MLRVLASDPNTTLRGLADAGRQRSFGRRTVQPKSSNQRRYLEAIEGHDMVFGIGPAGTGKTYLAVAMAISALLAKRVNRIILARPAVEAGERLGFLPGTLQDKIDPYLRPLYDALYDMLDPEKVDRYLEKNVIEIAPIAFMRGRTLNDSFVILDEAQNTTSEQMKMFVTRLGFNSKAVITGDVTQIDLPNARRSGLLEAMDVLKSVDGLAFVHFDETDVVRHHLVQRIVRAYDEHKTRVSRTADAACWPSPGTPTRPAPKSRRPPRRESASRAKATSAEAKGLVMRTRWRRAATWPSCLILCRIGLTTENEIAEPLGDSGKESGGIERRRAANASCCVRARPRA